MASQQEQTRDHFSFALKSNASWASYKQHSSPEYFQKFTAGQSPTILWLGCSDSRVPETTLLGLQPGEVFVHRNIANIITTSDLNVLAVIEYAVVHLKVAHIVLCGHTSCGGAAAALKDGLVGGVLDAWLTPLKVVRKEHKDELEAIKDDGERTVRLAELNVEEGVRNLMANAVVEDAIRERGLKVHGTIYDLGCGLLRELGVGTDKKHEYGEDMLEELKPGYVEGQGASEVAKRAEAQLAQKSADGSVPREEFEVLQGKHGVLVFGNEGATMVVR